MDRKKIEVVATGLEDKSLWPRRHPLIKMAHLLDWHFEWGKPPGIHQYLQQELGITGHQIQVLGDIGQARRAANYLRQLADTEAQQ